LVICVFIKLVMTLTENFNWFLYIFNITDLMVNIQVYNLRTRF
jgi:hypothetical protein